MQGKRERKRGTAAERESIPLMTNNIVSFRSVKLSEVHFVTKYNVGTAENMLRVMLMEPRTAAKTIDVDHKKILTKCLKMVSTCTCTI